MGQDGTGFGNGNGNGNETSFYQLAIPFDIIQDSSCSLHCLFALTFDTFRFNAKYNENQ
jgi:hypothetical protein